MKFNQIPTLRIALQEIGSGQSKSPEAVVGHMGAIQAQDQNMAKWAIGIRMPDATEKDINTAIDKGSVIRTHILRPTWHFVAASDIYWMLELTAPRIKSSLKSRHKELGLTPALLKKSNKLIETTLASRKHIPREELIEVFTKEKMKVNEQRSSHLLLWAELEGLICSGPFKNHKPTISSLNDRVPPQKKISKEEALLLLAQKYFGSHGPATIPDFSWWSGLSLTEAKHAVALNEKKFISEKIGDLTYYFPEKIKTSQKKDAVYLLPGYDEYIISYKDRSAIIEADIHKRAVSVNGIFKPIILVNGKVEGLWSREIQKDRILIRTEYFKKPSKKTEASVAKAAKEYGKFMDRPISVA